MNDRAFPRALAIARWCRARLNRLLGPPPYPTPFHHPSLASVEVDLPGFRLSWLAVDEEDCVAVFHSDDGTVPRLVAEHLPETKGAIDSVWSLPTRDSHSDDLAARGVYSYEARQGVYDREIPVRDPIRVSELPEEAQGAAQLIRLPTSFARTKWFAVPSERNGGE